MPGLLLSAPRKVCFCHALQQVAAADGANASFSHSMTPKIFRGISLMCGWRPLWVTLPFVAAAGPNPNLSAGASCAETAAALLAATSLLSTWLLQSGSTVQRLHVFGSQQRSFYLTGRLARRLLEVGSYVQSGSAHPAA